MKLAWGILWFAEVSAVNHLSLNVKKLTFTCRIWRERFVVHTDGSAVALNSVK